MALFTHYIGIWTRGTNPSNADVIAGTGAVAHATRTAEDGTPISQGFTGLTQSTDYDAEWLCVDDGAVEVRGDTVQFTSGVPEIAPGDLNAADRHIIHLIDLELDQCEHTYGTLPCTATLSSPLECYNTRKTCQDSANYSPVSGAYKIADIDAYQVDGYAPCVERIDMAPTYIIPGGGLAVRSKVSITCRDFAHHDRNVDPYFATRDYVASDRGTYFGKLFARNPHYWGRVMRVRVGVPGLAKGSFTEISNFAYLIDTIEGPDAKGKVKITGRDPLMLADSEKSQCPPLSTGVLSAPLVSNTTNRIELSTGAAVDYPAPGIVRVNDELIQYETVDAVNDWLEALTRGTLGTTAEDHDALSLVQLCKWYDDADPVTVLNDLLTNYAGVDPAVIPLTDWNAEQTEWFPGALVTNVVSEPTEVSKLLHDVCQQSAINLFWDGSAYELKLLADYRTELSATIPTFTDVAHLLDRKSAIKRDPKQRLSQVWVYHTPHNYLNIGGAQSFAGAEVRADLEAETPELYGQKQVHTLEADWLNSSAIAGQLASRMLKRFSDPPVSAKFDMDIREQEVQPGKHFYLSSRGVQNDTGDNALTLMQMLSVQYLFNEAIFRCEALSFKFPGRPALVNDDAAPPYSPDGAHRARAYICDSTTLLMGNGDPPYQIV